MQPLLSTIDWFVLFLLGLMGLIIYIFLGSMPFNDL